MSGSLRLGGLRGGYLTSRHAGRLRHVDFRSLEHVAAATVDDLKRPCVRREAEKFRIFWTCVSESGSPSTLLGLNSGAFGGDGDVGVESFATMFGYAAHTVNRIPSTKHTSIRHIVS